MKVALKGVQVTDGEIPQPSDDVLQVRWLPSCLLMLATVPLAACRVGYNL